MRRNVAVLLLCAIGSTACYKASFIRDPRAVRGKQHDRWISFFVFRLVGHERIDVHQFCPDGNLAEVRTGANFGTGLVSVLTIGIYTPRKVYVTCAAQASGTMMERLELLAGPDGRVFAAARVVGNRRQAGVVSAGPRPESFLVSLPEVNP